mgnify:CR=1 FL=1|jgi:hypothetical protein
MNTVEKTRVIHGAVVEYELTESDERATVVKPLNRFLGNDGLFYIDAP